MPLQVKLLTLWTLCLFLPLYICTLRPSICSTTSMVHPLRLNCTVPLPYGMQIHNDIFIHRTTQHLCRTKNDSFIYIHMAPWRRPSPAGTRTRTHTLTCHHRAQVTSAQVHAPLHPPQTEHMPSLAYDLLDARHLLTALLVLCNCTWHDCRDTDNTSTHIRFRRSMTTRWIATMATRYNDRCRPRTVLSRQANAERCRGPTDGAPPLTHALSLPLMPQLLLLLVLLPTAGSTATDAAPTSPGVGLSATLLAATAASLAAAATATSQGAAPGTPEPSHYTTQTTGVTLKKKRSLRSLLRGWSESRASLARDTSTDTWLHPGPALATRLDALRSRLVSIIEEAKHRGLSDWSSGVGWELHRAAWNWELDTAQPIGHRCKHANLPYDTAAWQGDTIQQAADGAKEPGTARIMFLNIRHFKGGVEGLIYRDEIWHFASTIGADWVGLNDHCLSVPPGAGGKWDRSGYGVHRLERFRASGVQAAAAKGFRGEGWGGNRMTWAIQQGLLGAHGPVGGTLLASCTGWDRADKEICDRHGYGRFTGRMIVGTEGKAVVLITVQGPSPSESPGSQWMQQQAKLQQRRKLGEHIEPDPTQQLLVDLYTALEPHVNKGRHIIVGGDFNLHWSSNTQSAASLFTRLEDWASALRLTHLASHLQHDILTWRRSDAPGAATTSPDHVFVSESMLGCVKALGCYVGHRINNSDHRPLVLDIAMHNLLGLAPDMLRLPPPPPKSRVKMLSCSDAKACIKFRRAVRAGAAHLLLENRLAAIEGAALDLQRLLGSTGEGWTVYGTDFQDGRLTTQLQSWWSDVASCLLTSQEEAHKHPNMQATSGRGTKQCWSPQFKQLNHAHREVTRLANLVENNRCSAATARLLTTQLQQDLHTLQHTTPLPPFPSGDHPSGLELHTWAKQARLAAHTLRKRLHGSKREELRGQASDRHAQLRASIECNKWKGLLGSELKKDHTSQDKHVLMVTEHTEDGPVRRLITDPDEVKSEARSFFAEWMGVGKDKWYRRADGSYTHPLHSTSTHGTALRRALVRGTLTEQQHSELLDGIPSECVSLLPWWRRKHIPVSTGSGTREIDETDYDDLNLSNIDEAEWVHCISSSSGNKAADARGTHINMLKALLPSKASSGGADRDDSQISDGCLRFLHLLRRCLNVMLVTGLVPPIQLEAVLCTIGKVQGSDDLLDSRPLTLMSITLNMALGIQMTKIMRRLDELQALDGWQAGFRNRTSTEEPLLETRLAAEHCWQFKKELWVGDEDKRRAFDCPPEASVELAMDRLAIPYSFIQFVKLVGSGSLIKVRTAHGLSAPFSKTQGVPQGGRHSPHLWTIFDDPLCTALAAEANEPGGDPLVVDVPFTPPVRLTGKSFADDKRFLSSTNAGMQRRFDLSARWNLLNEIETNVAKSAVQALSHRPGGKLATASQLPDVYMMNWRANTTETIPAFDPDTPLKSLGMLTTVALSDGYAVDAARAKADRVAVCVLKGSAPPEIWSRLLSQVAERAAMYSVLTSSVGKKDIADIQARSFRALKAKAGLCITTPSEVVSAVVSLDWASRHYTSQLMMIIKYLQRPHSNLHKLLGSAIMQHALWQGGHSTLGSQARCGRGWDSTLLGRLHIWMAENHLELVGGAGVQMGRLGDKLLIDLCKSPDDRNILAAGAWVVEAWRVSDLVAWDGSRVAMLRQGSSWRKALDQVEPGLGSTWCELVCSLLDGLPSLPTSSPCRPSIRQGSYVCLPLLQQEAVHDSDTLVVGRVEEDVHQGSWDDAVTVKILTAVPPGTDDHDLLLSRIRGPPILPPPTSLHSRTRSQGRTRGLIYVDLLPGGHRERCRAGDLLELKMAETNLRHAVLLPGHPGKSAESVLQLDECVDLDTAVGLLLGNAEAVPRSICSFEFEDRAKVIGLQAAADAGWEPKQDRWRDWCLLNEVAVTEGKCCRLLVISDGSVTGEGFSASSSYGWAAYDMELPGPNSPGAEATGPATDTSYALAGGGRVAGLPEWTSSTRAEAVGLLAALMGVITSGWRGDLEMRLDNDSAVGRAGGLVMEQGLVGTPQEEAYNFSEATLRDALGIENSDVWTEFAAWRDRHRALGRKLEVKWHPGHPERRKGRDKTAWNRHDFAIYMADKVADDMHRLPTPSRLPTEWSHKQQWRLVWRGTVQHGCLLKRVTDALRTEQLATYLRSAGVGRGSDTTWLIPELVARTIGKGSGSLATRVHRAKVVSHILGTRYTQLRRNGLDNEQDAMCRMCGGSLETDSHVLWYCGCPRLAKPRRALAGAVRNAWRRSGLSLDALNVATLLWRLDEHDCAICADTDSVHTLLGVEHSHHADLLVGALLGHTLDTTGLAVERAGLFGQGWLHLLVSLGLDRPTALNAMVTVMEVLQGPRGTRAIWDAFTEALADPACSPSKEHGPYPPSIEDFDSWLLSLKVEVGDMFPNDDAPIRAITTMGTRAMTHDDRSLFACRVASWKQFPSEWADTLAEAVLLAKEEVQHSRRCQGLRLATAREVARADAKHKALARRADLVLPNTGTPPHGAASPPSHELWQRPRVRPPPTHPPAPNKRARMGRPDRLECRKRPSGPGQSELQPHTRCKKSHRGQITTGKRHRPPAQQHSDNLTQLATPRQQHPVEDDGARAPKQHKHDSTSRSGKRGRQNETLEDRTPLEHSRMTRSKTREWCSVGTTNLEPD